jgi:putative transposase
MAKYNNKYRIESHRKPNWDYSKNGLYFITIVTQNRICNLGEIKNNEMILSDFGKIVENEWFKSFEMRKELILDEFIIMPNHLHAIVEIDTVETNGVSVETNGVLNHKTYGRAYLPERLPKSIATFIGGFKSAVNSKIDDFIDENNLTIPKYNSKNHFFQPNYHDHIIKNHTSYLNIINYIINNPMKWEEDMFKNKN